MSCGLAPRGRNLLQQRFGTGWWIVVIEKFNLFICQNLTFFAVGKKSKYCNLPSTFFPTSQKTSLFWRSSWFLVNLKKVRVELDFFITAEFGKTPHFQKYLLLKQHTKSHFVREEKESRVIFNFCWCLHPQSCWRFGAHSRMPQTSLSIHHPDYDKLRQQNPDGLTTIVVKRTKSHFRNTNPNRIWQPCFPVLVC